MCVFVHFSSSLFQISEIVFKCRFFSVIWNASDSYKTTIYRHQFRIRNEFDNVRLKWLSTVQNANFDQNFAAFASPLYQLYNCVSQRIIKPGGVD